MTALRVSLVAAILVWVACSKEDDSPLQPLQNQREEIPYTGTWQRQFEAGPGNVHTAGYWIYQDSIRYTLTGPVGNADYAMKRDTFLSENNRFIGHTTANQYYLIFVKNVTNDSLSLYKQTVSNVAEGMTIAVPDDATTANHGWNTYHK